MTHGRLLLLLCWIGASGTTIALAQSSEGNPSAAQNVPTAAAAPSSGSSTDDAQDASTLKQRQTQIGDRFERFETLLLRLADVEASENPERAALLRRASRQAREAFILERINGATSALDEGRYAQALKDQKTAQDSLSNLLQLLQSEDRQERIRQEKERIRQLINDLKRLERAQRSARSQTESGAEMDQAATQQKEVEQRAAELARKLDQEKAAAPTNPEGDKKPEAGSKEGDSKPNTQDKEPTAKEPKEPTPATEDNKPTEDSKPGEDKKPEGDKPEDSSKPSKGDEAKPSDSKPKEGSETKPQESPGQESKPQQGEPSTDSPPPQPQSPQQQAGEQLEQAQEQMRQAMKALEESRREDAVEPQRVAEAKLREAAEKLERILKQLREEEIERQLTRLESRLREIAARQTEILERTRILTSVPPEQRDRQTDVQSSNLAFEEKKIAADTDRALLLLAEDGSGRAFPEVLTEVRDDMLRISSRLSQTQLDLVTTGLQEDVVAALDEMIKSLQQEKRKREEEKQKNENPMQGQGQQQEDPLVDQIAELRLIKTQEQRIKNSTERYSGIAKATSPDADLQQLLDELSERQVRLYRVVRDIISEQRR